MPGNSSSFSSTVIYPTASDDHPNEQQPRLVSGNLQTHTDKINSYTT